MAKQKKGPSFPRGKDAKTIVQAAIKVEVERKANELIDTVLKPKHVEAPPEDAQFNYIVDISTRWHGSYLYFISIYACPGPNASTPRFEEMFARLEYAGGGKFNLCFRQRANQWFELCTGLSVEECLTAIRDDPWFMP